MNALKLIQEEIDKQSERGDVAAVEAKNSRNDRIAIAIAYLGRSSEKVLRNEKEGCDAKSNLIKAAAVICAAIENE